MTRSLGRRQLLQLGMGGAAGAAGLAGLSSCARGPGGSPEGSFGQPRVNVPAEFSKRKAIVAWSAFGGLAGDAMTELAKNFNRDQNDIYLDVQFQGGYGDVGQKLVASMQSGVAPDMVIVAEDSQGQLEMQEVASPLNEFVSKDTLDRLNKVMLDQWTVRGQIYQIPFARSTPVFYYNRDIYAKAGLPDRGPETWTEFREWAKEIRKVKDPQGNPMPCLTGSNSGWYFQAFIWEFGGKYSEGLDVLVNKGGAVDAAQYFHDLYVTDGLAIPNAGQDTFNNGFVASGIYSTASLSTIEQASDARVGAAFIPAEVERAVPTGGSGWTVPIGIERENKFAAGKVMEYFAQPENAAYWTLKSGYVPITKDATDTDIFRNQVADNPNYQVAPDQLEYARGTDPARSFVPGSGDMLGQYIGLIYSSEEPVQPILDRLATQLQRAADNVRPAYDKLMNGG